jgi:hypothetical protein
MSVLLRLPTVASAIAALALSVPAPRGASLLRDHLLITWYGNPRSDRMGVLGEQSGAARAGALRQQASAYATLTSKKVLMGYQLVAVVAQCTPGRDGRWRRREAPEVIQAMLDEARANGFRLILDVQPGHSTVAAEVAVLEPFLSQPDVDLALDPEFAMAACETPGIQIGQMTAGDVNGAIGRLEALIAAHRLPPKVLIVHQFRVDMLHDKNEILTSDVVDIVLNMDGFGSKALKRASYRTVMRQPLAFAGIKLFYRQDSMMFDPAEVLSLTPQPSVVVYQ